MFILLGAGIHKVDWMFVNGKRYFVPKHDSSQIEASEFCDSIGGYLAEPTNAEENEAIAKLAADNGLSYPVIGVDDKANEGKYVTIVLLEIPCLKSTFP